MAARCRELGAVAVPIHDFVYHPGMGIVGKSESGIVYWVGTESLAKLVGLKSPMKSVLSLLILFQKEPVRYWPGTAKRPFWLSRSWMSCGNDARKAIEELKHIGIRPVLLTGDKRATAEHVASLAGIEQVVAEVRPEGKAAVVEALKKDGHKVAVVGDGINDSEALALADVSVAMGTGSEIAIETAQLTLSKADISGLPRALRLSAATRRVIKENLFSGIHLQCGRNADCRRCALSFLRIYAQSDDGFCGNGVVVGMCGWKFSPAEKNEIKVKTSVYEIQDKCEMRRLHVCYS